MTDVHIIRQYSQMFKSGRGKSVRKTRPSEYLLYVPSILAILTIIGLPLVAVIAILRVNPHLPVLISIAIGISIFCVCFISADWIHRWFIYLLFQKRLNLRQERKPLEKAADLIFEVLTNDKVNGAKVIKQLEAIPGDPLIDEAIDILNNSLMNDSFCFDIAMVKQNRPRLNFIINALREKSDDLPSDQPKL